MGIGKQGRQPWTFRVLGTAEFLSGTRFTHLDKDRLTHAKPLDFTQTALLYLRIAAASPFKRCPAGTIADYLKRPGYRNSSCVPVRLQKHNGWRREWQGLVRTRLFPAILPLRRSSGRQCALSGRKARAITGALFLRYVRHSVPMANRTALLLALWCRPQPVSRQRRQGRCVPRTARQTAIGPVDSLSLPAG